MTTNRDPQPCRSPAAPPLYSAAPAALAVMAVSRDGSFAHLGQPLLQALRHFFVGAAELDRATELERAVPCAKELLGVLEEDLLLEAELAGRGGRPGQLRFVSNLTWRRRCYKASSKCERLRKSLE